MVAHLEEAGIDPAQRVELIVDYIKADARLAVLRAAETSGRGRNKLAAARAATTLQSERRRLYRALFGGAREADPPPTPAETAQAERDGEADAAWREHYRTMRGRSRAKVDAEARSLEARYGEPSWNALLYRTPEEQADAEAKIAAYDSRARGGRQRTASR